VDLAPPFSNYAVTIDSPTPEEAKGPMCRPFGLCGRCSGGLLHIDGPAVGVERALHADLHAFILLQFFWVIDVINLAAGAPKNERVARVHYHADEHLAVVGRLGLGVVAAALTRARGPDCGLPCDDVVLGDCVSACCA
jgi:hypothetical protein